ncbi:MAG: hypothetical protein JNM85_05920 [Chthonomonas sp.]|nr:hypothetical protein [Chthonomonas sp.]
MTSILKTIAIVILAIIGFRIAVGLAFGLIGVILKFGFAALALGAIIYMIYSLSGGRKALGGVRNPLP